MSEVAAMPRASHRNLDEIAAELPSETGALVDYILARYHETHRHQLPRLIELSRKVEQVHAGKPGVPAGLADILHKALGELEVHMRKEELMIFPAMCRADSQRRFDGPTAMLRTGRFRRRSRPTARVNVMRWSSSRTVTARWLVMRAPAPRTRSAR